MEKPTSNKRIFRDVVLANIDYDFKANFEIERVIERGNCQISEIASNIMAWRK
jgi:hypothetical protein